MTQTSPTPPSGSPPAISAGIAVAADQAHILEIGRRIQSAWPRRSPLRYLDDAVSRRITARAVTRTAFYRTVDVAPACDGADVARHLVQYLAGGDASASRAARLLGAGPLTPALGALIVRGVRLSGRRSIAAETPQRALGECLALWRGGIGVTVDLLGEAVVSATEAARYLARCTEALETFSEATARWPARPELEADAIGPIPRVSLSVKPSALTARMHADAPALGLEDARPRLATVLRRARELDAHVHVDMESLDTRETTLALLLELLSEPEFANGPSVGLVVQAYLRDADEVVDRIVTAAVDRRAPLLVRLVKGAYWDHERVQSAASGWPSPVFDTKRATDRNFERLTRRLLAARPHVRLAVASHNLRSVSHALACADATELGRAGLEVQVLRGLGDELAVALRATGVVTRVYTPVGDLLAGMAYLVRRLLENTANESFLVAQHQSQSLRILLEAP